MKASPLPRRLLVALVVSLAGHAGAAMLLTGFAMAPALDLEFVVPAEIELGSDEAIALDLAAEETEPEPPPIEETPAAAPMAAEASPTPAPLPDLGPPDLGPPDLGPPDLGPPDLGPPDLGPPDLGSPDLGPPDLGSPDGGPGALEDAGPSNEDGGAEDGGAEDGGAEDGGAEDGGADAGPRPRVADRRAIPPGAQLAMRLDLARLESSPIAESVRELLAAIPDWQLLLDGSGIDPLRDLDRLLIATPSLRRSQMVLAGRHTHREGPDYVRVVVQRFGAARGVPTPWSRELGVALAPWPNPDRTPRVIAITGPRHFIISRPVDLPRILAIAQAREEPRSGGDASPPPGGEDEDADGPGTEAEDPADGHETPPDALEGARGADSLLAMGPREVFRVDAEGIANFIRGGNAAMAPTSMRLAFRERGGEGLRLVGEATYPDPEAAAAGLAFWEEKRRALLANGLARIVMGGTLSRALRGIEAGPPRGRRVPLRLDLTVAQARLVLSRITRVAEGAAQASRRPTRNGAPAAGPGEAPTRTPGPGAPPARAQDPRPTAGQAPPRPEGPAATTNGPEPAAGGAGTPSARDEAPPRGNETP